MAQIAIEIQWSGQTIAETERRHAQYAESGVRALWLMRRLTAPISEAVPAVRISQNEDGTFNAHTGEASGGQLLSIQEFLSAAFQGRLKFGLPLGAQVILTVQAGMTPCWAFGAFTRIITGFGVETGPHKLTFSVADFDGAKELLRPIIEQLPMIGIGEIKSRYSRTMQTSYLSNGCAHCDALFGRSIFNDEACQSSETILTVAYPMSKAWQRFLSAHSDCDSWGVFDFAD